MAGGGNASENRSLRVEMQCVLDTVPEQPAGTGLRASGQQEAGEAEGQRRLANAGRATDQPGMGQPSGAGGRDQGLLGGRMAHQVGIGPRRQGFGTHGLRVQAVDR